MIFSGMVSAAGESLIIEDVVLIDGTGRPPVKQASVLVREERIVEIKRGKFTSSQRKDARVISGRHKYLIPGLMDVHVHLAGSIHKRGNRGFKK